MRNILIFSSLVLLFFWSFYLFKAPHNKVDFKASSEMSSRDLSKKDHTIIKDKDSINALADEGIGDTVAIEPYLDTQEALILSREDFEYLKPYNPALSLEDKRSFIEYFEQDTKNSQWAFETEAQFYEILDTTEFREKYADFPIHDLSCRDTICKISMENKSIPYSFFEHFTRTENLDEYRTLTRQDENNVSHIFIFRRM